MKILVIGPCHPELVGGGPQQIAYELFEGLKSVEGVEPIFLASVDTESPEQYPNGTCITGFDGRANEFLFHSRGYNPVWHRIHNGALARSFQEFLEGIKPDVVHFHHYINFGIDYLTLARRVLPRTRIIFTLYDFTPICSADGHLRYRTGRVGGMQCQSASAKNCHLCVPEYPPEHYTLREVWIKSHLASVNMLTVPSRFMISLYKSWGLDESKIAYVTNGLNAHGGPISGAASPGRNRFGFFGRLIDDKGVVPLFLAVQRLKTKGFVDFIVEINDTNRHLASPIARTVVEQHLAHEEERPPAQRNVVFNGSYRRDQLRTRMAQIDWVVVPSLWKEAFCVVISEAWAYGRPVIVSDIGALTERVTDGKDGLLFPPGQADALANLMHRACTEKGLWEQLVQGIKSCDTREVMVRDFMDVYATATQRHSILS